MKVHYREARIPKGNGKNGYRRMFIPKKDSEFASAIKMLSVRIGSIAKRVCGEEATAFIKGISLKSNAAQHADEERLCCVKMDVRNFFDNINKSRFLSMLKIAEGQKIMTQKECRFIKSKINLMFVKELNNGLPQGFSTSPAMSNIYAYVMIDRHVTESLSRRAITGELPTCTYTRYADDTTVSLRGVVTNEQISIVINILRRAVMNAGLRINPKKTEVTFSSSSETVVTGIAINKSGRIKSTRATKRKLQKRYYEIVKSGKSYKNDASFVGLLGFVNHVSQGEGGYGEDGNEDYDFLKSVKNV